MHRPEWDVYVLDQDKQSGTLTFPEAANEPSSCACKGLGAAPGSACTSSSLTSGTGHVLAALCTGCPHGPGGTLMRSCTCQKVKNEKNPMVQKPYGLEMTYSLKLWPKYNKSYVTFSHLSFIFWMNGHYFYILLVSSCHIFLTDFVTELGYITQCPIRQEITQPDRFSEPLIWELKMKVNTPKGSI